MAPADEWPDARIDELAERVRVVSALATPVGVQGAKIDELGDHIELLRTAQRDLSKELRAAVSAIGAACEAHTLRVERKIDEVEDKIDADREARRWGPMAIVGAMAAILAPMSTVLVVLLGGSPS